MVHPDGLVAGSAGDLYIADVGRDQIFERLPSGKYRLVAGSGRRGFSGDGGPAARAEIDLLWSSGLALANNGTLYISDSGNGRVRAVAPDGIICTVAGDGKGGAGMVLRSMPALKASLGEVAGLAIGPDDDLYIAAGNVVKLTPGGNLQSVAGNNAPFACGTAFCNPASEPDFRNPGGLAFDASGDLFVSTWSYGLYEVTPLDKLDYLGQERGDDGAPEALAGAPGGAVLEANHAGLFRLTTGAQGKVVHTTVIALGPGDPTGPLDRALGANNIFVDDYGVAAGPDGMVYADTNTGNAWTNVSALVEVTPGGAVRALWKSANAASR